MTNAPPRLKILLDHVSCVLPSSAGEIEVLRDICLGIRESEIVSILGPSGCGKSTVLNLIAGFLRPTRGSITVDDRRVKGPGPDRGLVFQDYALFRWLTVRGNVEFGPRMRGVPVTRRREIADQFLRMVGLTGFADRYPYELSGGMKQRVAIARVFANESDVLLMDEPFASLDAQTREIMQEELVQLWLRTRRTIVFVTHSVEEALFVSSRIVVMSARPASIKRLIDVDLPAQRFDYHIRTSPRFTELRGEVLELVRSEVKTLE
jgi:NitT/TauT family transport system ATP-binding protein